MRKYEMCHEGMFIRHLSRRSSSGHDHWKNTPKVNKTFCNPKYWHNWYSSFRLGPKFLSFKYLVFKAFEFLKRFLSALIIPCSLSTILSRQIPRSGCGLICIYCIYSTFLYSMDAESAFCRYANICVIRYDTMIIIIYYYMTDDKILLC